MRFWDFVLLMTAMFAISLGAWTAVVYGGLAICRWQGWCH